MTEYELNGPWTGVALKVEPRRPRAAVFPFKFYAAIILSICLGAALGMGFWA